MRPLSSEIPVASLRILFVQCFATAGRPEVAPRERALASLLLEMGHTVKMLGISRHKVADVAPGPLDMTVFRVDDKSVGKANYSSAALVRQAAEFKPDVVIFKNNEFDVCRQVQEALPLDTVLGMVVGGRFVMRNTGNMDMGFVEHEGQLPAFRKRVEIGRMIVEVMPKLVLWPVVEESFSAVRDVDVCVVGSFNERKNPQALIPLFGDVSISFAGGGQPGPELIEAAAGKPDVKFLGPLAHHDVFRLMCRSKLLVHPSRWEGVPRVSAEAFACGTPMVALRSTLGAAYGNAPFVALVEQDTEIRDTVQAILRDPARLAAMSAAAREFALRVHGPHRLEEVARRIVDFAAKRRPHKIKSFLHKAKKAAARAAAEAAAAAAVDPGAAPVPGPGLPGG